MNRAIHLYPFAPWGMFGGSMRVRFAAEATAQHVETSVYWWDPSVGGWAGPLAPNDVGAPGPMAAGALEAGRAYRFKRMVFPSAMWETGRRACSPGALPPVGNGEAAVLHCSILAPLVQHLKARGARVAVDVHDLIYRTHEDDARLGSLKARPLRLAYASSVRRREIAGLSEADAVLFAGWTDHRDFRRLVPHRRSGWAPTGLRVPPSAQERDVGLRVGIIGNFAHLATAQPAHALLDSPLEADPEVEFVFAGMGSAEWAAAHAPNATALGRVATVGEFYDNVDAVVVPVTNASGMKTKLAEAALAGVPVVTTSAGAAGYSPELRRSFAVVDDLRALTPAYLRSVLDRVKRADLIASFQARVGREGALRNYEELLSPVLDHSSR